ncbi:hypothetical protein Sbal195_4574 (plasmid) [Shewanella baltica OS195]|uniref:Uncharacterized protein n=1 Tax=Shewanella baltica (strain OS195) TaxID=399599 RepID=A9L6E8_SHEB9|nr:hypothetical protein [Shewanella baltica]ABX51730.1 hypothetical protein Sbal195_4574 [Shewanella baltica OS195]
MEILKPIIIGAAPLVLASFIVVKLGYVSVEFGSDPFNRSHSEISLQKKLDKIEKQRDNLKLLDKVFSFPSEKDTHIWQNAIASCEGKQTDPCEKLRASLEGYASAVTGLAKQIDEANGFTK